MTTAANRAGISRRLVEGLVNAEADFIVSVPCRYFDGLLASIADDPRLTHIPVTREEEGVGLCAGAALAGRFPVLAMQNSGLGNSLNAIASLVQFYRLPLLMLISHRGTDGERTAAQVPMGAATPGLLEVLGIACDIVRAPADLGRIEAAITAARAGCVPRAVLFPIAFWKGDA